MNGDVVQIAQVLVVFSMFGAFITAGAVAVKLILNREKRKAAQLSSPAMRVDDSRFERLEQAVDAIALEVERMSEAQRFTAKLLTERAPDRLAAPDAQSQQRDSTPR